MVDARWEIADDVPPEDILGLARPLGVPSLIAEILLKRGITNPDGARAFFQPDLSVLYDPFLLKDMDRAVERIITALNDKEKIFIYGDYDVDGITAVSTLYLFFKQIGGEVRFYIPDRLSEGYGISETGVEEAIRIGSGLIISVDCGITSVAQVALAKKAGVGMIITDHHEPGGVLPDAVAILDPKQEDCHYPFKELAGVGVAYKLIQGLSRQLGLDPNIAEQYIDFAAIGSAADIVPLVDENRALVKVGLEKINSDPGVGLTALIETAGLDQGKIGVSQIVFGLAPRMNAVGRMGSAERAVRLLITQNPQQAKNIARILELENRRRKQIDEDTLDQALDKIEQQYDEKRDRAIVLSQIEWHPGVIGIVASRIVERFYRPTIMIAVEDGVGKGSARSIRRFDIYSALKQCKDLLLQFGGHKYAAGLTIEEKNIGAFQKRFNGVASRMLSHEDLVPKLKIEAQINLGQITPPVVEWLKRFAPFGPQNMRPVFMTRGLEVVGTPRIVGNNHLKFKVRQRGLVFDAIGYNLGDFLYRIDIGQPNLNMAYIIEENEYLGKKTVQLRARDLK